MYISLKQQNSIGLIIRSLKLELELHDQRDDITLLYGCLYTSPIKPSREVNEPCAGSETFYSQTSKSQTFQKDKKAWYPTTYKPIAKQLK